MFFTSVNETLNSGVTRIRRHCSATFLSLAIFLGFVLFSRQAVAGPTECAAAYEDGQRLMTKALLLESAKQFRYCGSPACPAVMHAECLRFLDRVEAMTPSVVIRLEPELPVQARVSIDEGLPVALDGRALSLDPGTHRLRLSAPGYAVADRQFLVAEGETLKMIEVQLVPLPRPRPSELAKPRLAPATSPSVVPWIVTGAIAGIGAAGLTYWGLKARNGEAALSDCSPDCPASRVNAVKGDYRLANVSLGVGVTGLVAMAVWYALSPSSTARRTTAVSPSGASGSAAGLSDWTLRL